MVTPIVDETTPKLTTIGKHSANNNTYVCSCVGLCAICSLELHRSLIKLLVNRMLELQCDSVMYSLW